MVSLEVQPLSSPPEFPSIEELASMEQADAVEHLVDWFYFNFEDPVHNAPYDSREGGYQYVWGGPYEARDELEGSFGGLISDEILEAAIEAVEDNEGPLFTASSRRVQPDGPDYDDIFTSPGSIDGLRAQALSDLRALEKAWADIAPAPIGHNNPPEPMEAVSVLSQAESEDLAQAITGARTQLTSDNLNPEDLQLIVIRIKKVASRVATALAGIALLGAGALVEGAANKLGEQLVSSYFVEKHETFIEAANRAGHSVSKLIEALPFY